MNKVKPFAVTAAVAVLMTLMIIPCAATSSSSWETLYYERFKSVAETNRGRIEVKLLDLDFDGTPELHIVASGMLVSISTIKDGMIVDLHDSRGNEFSEWLPNRYSAYRHKEDGTIHWMNYETDTDADILNEYRFALEEGLVHCDVLFERYIEFNYETGEFFTAYQVNGADATQAQMKEAQRQWKSTYREIPGVAAYNCWHIWVGEDAEEWFHEVSSQYEPMDISKPFSPWSLIGYGGVTFLLMLALATVFFVKHRKRKKNAA